MALSTPTQRTLLLGFICSLALCGLIGIYALVMGQFGWLEMRVLGTTASIGAASILAMASAVAWETRRWRPIGLVGMILPGVALLLLLVLIWDFAPRTPRAVYERFTGSTCIVAVATAHVALLALARLHRGYEWVRTVTVTVIGALAVILILTIIVEPNDDDLGRIIGSLAIIDVCGSVAVPVLHRVSAISSREQVRTTNLEVTVICPRCETSRKLPVGRSRCACGLRFLIEVEEEHCPRCGYALYKLTSNACPECGAPLTPAALAAKNDR